MLLKPYFDYESKSIFAYFTVVSCLIHLIFIFSVPSLSRLFSTGLDPTKYPKKNNNYIIEVVFEPDQEVDEKEIDEEMIEEMEKTMEEFLEEKKVFVDTSDLTEDVEPTVDTEKIGEKGSVAKDMYLEKDGINNEPRLTGESEMLAKAPDELTAVKPEYSGFPIEVVENVQPLIEKEKMEETPVVDNSKIIQMDEEVETFPKIQEVFEALEKQLEIIKGPEVEELDEVEEEVEELDEVEEEVEQEPGPPTQEIEPVEIEESETDIEKEAKDIMIEISEENAEMVTVLVDKIEDIVQEAEPVAKKENKTEIKNENIDKVAEAVKEYIEVAEASKNKIKEIVEDSEKETPNEIKKDVTRPQPQNNIPTGKNIPYFEDTISNAPDKGEQSFNIKKSEYAVYYKHIRDRITRYWLIQYGTDASIRLATQDYKPVIVKFKVIPSGRIIDVKVADSAGNELLSSKVQQSIRNTILNRFPDYVNEEFINVKFNFYFF